MIRPVVLLGALALAGPAHAADPAAPDRRYGDRGVARTGYAKDFAALPGGGVVAVGGRGAFGVARLDARGRPAGRTEVAVPGGAGAEQVAVQPDGKLVVAGGVMTGDPPGRVLGVARLTPDLALDTSFGEGGVTVLADVTAPADLAVTAAGRIVVLTDRFRLVALGPDGRADPGFSGDGHADPLADLGAPDPEAGGTRLLAFPDGRLLALGQSAFEYYGDGSDSDPLLLRIGADGTTDRTFGQGGVARAVFVRGTDLTVQPSGRIVVSGYSCGFFKDPFGDSCPFEIARFTPDGRPDTGFGEAGARAVPRTDGDAHAVQALRDGRLLVAGPGTTARLSPGGALDLGYGRCGTGSAGAVSHLFPQPGGPVLVAGGRAGGSGRVVRLIGGSGKPSRRARPPYAPSFPADDDHYVVGNRDEALFLPAAYFPVDARIRARIRIVALGESYDHVPLSDRMLRRLRLPRTVATGDGTVRACRRRTGIRVRFHAAARRRLRALERDEPWLLEVVVEARNAGGSARSTDKLGLDSRGRVTNVDD